MKIGVGDPDVPRNETMRSDLDLLLRHDERTIEQREIADCAMAILADRKRTTRVT